MCREDARDITSQAHRQPGSSMKYSSASSVGRSYRSSMISPRYRQREERRKMLKISAGKLSRIEDPETSLCRSVLINNTLRRLRRETALPPPMPPVQQLPDFAPLDYPPSPPSPPPPSPPSPPPAPAPISTEAAEDDCDQDPAMFCVPPTPRLLSSIDDDDDAALLGLPAAKRPRADQEFTTCGQASAVLDGAVFHSLMTSLETT